MAQKTFCASARLEQLQPSYNKPGRLQIFVISVTVLYHNYPQIQWLATQISRSQGDHRNKSKNVHPSVKIPWWPWRESFFNQISILVLSSSRHQTHQQASTNHRVDWKEFRQQKSTPYTMEIRTYHEAFWLADFPPFSTLSVLGSFAVVFQVKRFNCLTAHSSFTCKLWQSLQTPLHSNDNGHPSLLQIHDEGLAGKIAGICDNLCQCVTSLFLLNSLS